MFLHLTSHYMSLYLTMTKLQDDRFDQRFVGESVTRILKHTMWLKQGDQGDYYYILDSGTADVFIRKGNDPELKVNNYTAGGAFGELALLHGERAIERDSFYYIIVLNYDVRLRWCNVAL